MGIILNEHSEEIIRKRLGVENLDELINRDFKDINIDNDIDREEVKKYFPRILRDLRLALGYFMTYKERESWKERASKIKLP